MDEVAPRPPFSQVIWSTLQALRDLGGSGANREIAEKALEVGGYTDEQKAVLNRGVGPETEIEYRVAWARTYLKGVGALENSRRGVWSLTDKARSITQENVAGIPSEYNRLRRVDQATNPNGSTEEEAEAASTFDPSAWKSELLEAMLAMDPSAFERLTKRLLREAGFSSVQVTGRTSDGGIDGTGVYSPSSPSLISFPVVFQCKKYQGSVGPSLVRDLRGAMSGRGDKGIFVTTGSFTREAQAEASRDGVPTVELIDGDRLCDLLKEFGLGIEVENIERVSVKSEFFADI